MLSIFFFFWNEKVLIAFIVMLIIPLLP